MACRASPSSACRRPRCKEANDRVRAALQNCALRISRAPHHRQPRAGRPAEGIAAASTCRSRSGSLPLPDRLPAAALDQYEFAGELALSGELRPIRGALAMTYVRAVGSRPRVRPAGGQCATKRRWCAMPPSIPPRTSACRCAHISPAREPLPALRAASAQSARASLSGSVRRQGTGAGQARAGSRRGGRHSILMIGPAGHRQDHAGRSACPASCRR